MSAFRHNYLFQAARTLQLAENPIEIPTAILFSEVLSPTQKVVLWESLDCPESSQNLANLYLELIEVAQARFDKDSEFDFLARLTKLRIDTPSQQAVWLVDYSAAASRRGLHDEALQALNRAIEISKKQPPIQTKAQVSKALLLGYAGDFESSRAIFDRAFKYCDANEVPALKASAYMNASVIFRRNQEIDKAHEYAIIAESSYRASGNISGAAKALHQQSRILFSNGQRVQAFELLDEARAMFDLTGDRLSWARTTSELASFKLQCDDADEAKTDYLEALYEFRQIHSIRDELIVISNLGLIEYNKGQFDSALALFASTIDLARSADDKIEEAYALALMADATHAKGDTKTAELLADQANEFVDTVKLPLFQIVLNKILAELAAARKDLYQALSYVSNSRKMAGDTGYAGMHVLLLARESYFFSELGDFVEAKRLGLLAMDEAENIDEGGKLYRFVATATMARLETLNGTTDSARTLRDESHTLRNTISEHEINNDQLVRFTINWLDKVVSLP